MLNSSFIPVPTSSKIPVDLLKNTDSYSLSSINDIPFQTNVKLNATANSFQTFHQPHTARYVGVFASLPSSSSVPKVNPINPPLVRTHSYITHFMALNKTSKTVEGVDHQIFAEEFLP